MSAESGFNLEFQARSSAELLKKYKVKVENAKTLKKHYKATCITQTEGSCSKQELKKSSTSNQVGNNGNAIQLPRNTQMQNNKQDQRKQSLTIGSANNDRKRQLMTTTGNQEQNNKQDQRKQSLTIGSANNDRKRPLMTTIGKLEQNNKQDQRKQSLTIGSANNDRKRHLMTMIGKQDQATMEEQQAPKKKKITPMFPPMSLDDFLNKNKKQVGEEPEDEEEPKDEVELEDEDGEENNKEREVEEDINYQGDEVNETNDSTTKAALHKRWIGQLGDVILSAFVHVLWMIWFARNQLRFNDTIISFNRAVHLILANVSLSGNSSSGSVSGTIVDFEILKAFSVTIRPRKAPTITQVDWYKPPCGWIKCNSDGASRGNPGLATLGGIFRDSSGAFMGCFSDFVGISTSFHAELLAAMKAIEIAYEKGWTKFWLECDSTLVRDSFHSINLVPWQLQNRWRNCILMANKMQFFISHIFREGNSCADKLAAYGISSQCFTWWDLPTRFTFEDFNRNRLGLPTFRFR